MTQAFKQGVMDKLAQTTLGGMQGTNPAKPIRHVYPAQGLYTREMPTEAINTQLTRPDSPYSRIYNSDDDSVLRNVDLLPGSANARRMKAVIDAEDSGIPGILASHIEPVSGIPLLKNETSAPAPRTLQEKLRGFWDSPDKAGIIKTWAGRNPGTVKGLAVGGGILAGGAGLYGLYRAYQAQKEQEEEDRIMRRRAMFKGASDSFIAGAMSKLAQAAATTAIPPVAKQPTTARSTSEILNSIRKLGPVGQARVSAAPEVSKALRR